MVSKPNSEPWALSFSLILLSSNAYSQTTTAPSQTAPSIWWLPLVSALIGVLAALITPFIKDLFIQNINVKRAKSENQREVFRNYAAPTVMACEKLIWRFSEIFIENRHQFLKTATLPVVYNQYKRRSTLYRIACILGWIRAINIELSALPRGASGFLLPVSKAVKDLQSALADGPHVEIHRLKQMCDVWRIDISSQPEAFLKNLATKIEVKLYQLGGESLKHNSEYLKNMSSEEKFKICHDLAEFLCSELGRINLHDDVIAATVPQAIVAMSYREALIYRDWQDAIGDSMLELDQESVRRFKTIGYEKFEEILDGKSLWIEVFRESIDDIDFEKIDPNDFRTEQLKTIAKAVSNIIIMISKTEDRDLVDDNALSIAKQLVARV